MHLISLVEFCLSVHIYFHVSISHALNICFLMELFYQFVEMLCYTVTSQRRHVLQPKNGVIFQPIGRIQTFFIGFTINNISYFSESQKFVLRDKY